MATCPSPPPPHRATSKTAVFALVGSQKAFSCGMRELGMYSGFQSRLKKACSVKETIQWHFSAHRKEWLPHPHAYPHPHPNRFQWGLGAFMTGGKLSNESLHGILLPPVVFCYGKYLLSSSACVDFLNCDMLKSSLHGTSNTLHAPNRILMEVSTPGVRVLIPLCRIQGSSTAGRAGW